MAAAAGPLSSKAPPPGTLNLTDEVVKMRKEVKRIPVLVIRKLVRTVARLKSKKGDEDQRRAQQLLEEIHAMKGWQSVEHATVMPVNLNKSSSEFEGTVCRGAGRLHVAPASVHMQRKELKPDVVIKSALDDDIYQL